jgi:hypothetical protein
VTPRTAAYPPDTRPQVVAANARRSRFVAEAEHFAARHGRALCFRYLQWLTGCTDEQLAMAVKKIFCDSLTEGTPRFETRLQAVLKSLLHPFHYVWLKEYLWRPAPKADFDLETSTTGYFQAWFAEAYGPVRGKKRITQTSRMEPVPGYETVGPITRSVRLPVILKLFLAPLFIPQLLAVAPAENRPNILAAYRKAMGIFASHDGHFRRYPCHHFVTYADENNHPLRYVAFKRWCSGSLIAVQNGERQPHPYSAFSLIDVYLTFGESVGRLYPELKMSVGRTVVVGALCLNERHRMISELAAKAEPVVYDVLFIDEKVYPYNGLDYKTGGTGFFKMFENTNRYKKNRPQRRVAYQLRPYGSAAEKAAVLEVLKRYFTEDVEFLENSGKGESYANIMRSKVVITFNSTLGYEAFFLRKGVKTLFVNYGGNAHEILSADARFQLYDEDASYEDFERQLDMLLQLELDDVPAVARERHGYFDGRVQERIAAFLNEVAPS